MSQAPTPVEVSSGGFAPPVVTQFAVFLDNRVGKLRQLAGVFEGQGLTLCALSVVDAVSYAVCRVVTSNATLARRLLRRAGLSFSEVDLLAVEIDRDHTLTQTCQYLTTVEVNIHYVYPLWVQPRGHPVMAVYTDDNTFAAQVLRKKLVTLLGENELGSNATGSDPLSDELDDLDDLGEPELDAPDLESPEGQGGSTEIPGIAGDDVIEIDPETLGDINPLGGKPGDGGDGAGEDDDEPPTLSDDPRRN